MENLDQLLSFFSTEFHNDESQHQTERGVLNQGYMNKTADHIPIDILNYINNHPFVLEANVMNRQALPFLEHSLDTNAQHMHISQENTETHIDTNLSNGNIGIPLHFLDTSNTANAQPPPVLTANVDGNGRDSEAISRPNAQKSTSNYLGVSKHCHTEKFEAHIWDSSFIKEGGKRKGRQVYLGSYENEEEAARSYDLAAIKFRGPATTTNFPLSHYGKDMEKMMQMTTNDYVTFLRRKSCGFARGKSEYRGVTRSRSNGKWQARIGRVYKNKDLYLGAFDREEDAAEAYDVAAIRFRGLKALTNFDPRRYNIPENMEANHIFSCNNATSKQHNVVINKESVANETSQFLPSLEARTSSSVGYTNNHGSGWNSHPLSHEQNSSTHLVEMVGTSTSSDLGLGDIDKASLGLLDLLDMSDNIILPFEINPGAEFGSAALLNLPYVSPHIIGQDLTVRGAIEARDMDYSQNLPWYHNPSFFSENGDFDSNTSASQL